MPFKLSNLNSNLTLTLGYLNPALDNSARVRYIMPENLSIMLLSITLKTMALCLKLCSKSSRLCSTILGYILCAFPCLQTKNTSINQKYHILLQQLQIYKKWTTNNTQKHSKCLISMELSIVRILSDHQFAAWHNDANGANRPWK